MRCRTVLCGALRCRAVVVRCLVRVSARVSCGVRAESTPHATCGTPLLGCPGVFFAVSRRLRIYFTLLILPPQTVADAPLGGSQMGWTEVRLIFFDLLTGLLGC